MLQNDGEAGRNTQEQGKQSRKKRSKSRKEASNVDTASNNMVVVPLRHISPTINESVGYEQLPNTFSIASSSIDCSEIFYGRDEIIKDINSAFTPERRVVFLRGMGGIGKSEIAKQYIKRHRDFYTTVVFARYESSLASLIADDNAFSISNIGRKTKEDNSLQTDEEYADDKIKIIKQISDEHTLIVIDNFDVSSDPYMEKLFVGITYRIIVTTRCEPVRGKYHVIPIQEIDDDALKDMVIDFANPDMTMIDPADPSFPELFDLTNRHTLTLELIAKHMSDKSIDSVCIMVNSLKAAGLKMLSENDATDGYRAICGIFDMTNLSEVDKSFLRNLAMMPPSGVNSDMFRKWCGESIYSARARLAKLSLIKVNVSTKTLSLHPVIREVVESKLKPSYENCREFVDAFLLEIEENEAWNYEMERKNTLGENCWSILARLGNLNSANFKAYYDISVFLNFVDDYSVSLKRLEELLSFSKDKFGVDSPEVACVLFRKGWIAKNRLMIDAAEGFHRDALKIFEIEKNRDKSACEYIHCLCELADIVIKKGGCIEKAFELSQKAYDYAAEAVKRELFADANIRKALAARTLAKCYVKEEKYAEAEALIEEGLQIQDVDNYPLDGAGTVARMAFIIKLKTGHSAAESLFLKAIDLYKQYGIKFSSTYLDCLCELAEYYAEIGDLEKSKKYWDDALLYVETVLEKGHPSAIQTKERRSLCIGSAD